MKQTISYLYEYENNKQVKNVGFVKCIFHKGKVTFQIHGKGLECDKFMNLEMFLFTSDNVKCETEYVGMVEGNQGAVNYIVTVDHMDMEKFQSYDGIILETKNHQRYIGTWKRKEIHLERIIASAEVEQSPDSEVMEEVELTSVSEEIEGDDEGEMLQTEKCEMEFQEAVRKELEVELDDVLDEDDDMYKKYQKINRQDIADLPQREWKLANNNFLIHGFTNYKHLILIREEQQLYLGVPGVYHQREEAAAKSFGFPMFHQVDGKALHLEDAEYDTEGTFGYWCRPVSERRRMEQRYESRGCTN